MGQNQGQLKPSDSQLTPRREGRLSPDQPPLNHVICEPTLINCFQPLNFGAVCYV